ncbi:hypothetical protein [Microbacterium allomyrinae]|uniref:Uncharacterized protein n=1 Tax=Microbacterium allomyrinae TaxID=2830666 RepID=A0A9X1LYU4_9MICO|nr:hypothetical protein [Microbacterium allomyrinae]MCC2034118.1 hypothetical protein [Microbacterium allomyrinae]
MIDVTQSREIQATIYALRLARRDIRLNINKRARAQIKPLWQREVASRARSRRAQRVIAGGVGASLTDRGVRLRAATSSRPLRGGLVPAEQYAGDEFGARTQRIQVRQRSRKGRVYTRPLTINRQFPGRTHHGMVAFDAASVTGRRLVALWVAQVVEDLGNVENVEVVG